MTYKVRLLLFIGLVLSALAALAPLADLSYTGLIQSQVRTAYPEWAPDVVSLEVNAIAGWLVVTGALGAVGWLVTLLGVHRGARWAWPTALTLFLGGLTVALANVSVGGERYDTIVPAAYGWLSFLPVLVGVAALVAVRRSTATAREARA